MTAVGWVVPAAAGVLQFSSESSSRSVTEGDQTSFTIELAKDPGNVEDVPQGSCTVTGHLEPAGEDYTTAQSYFTLNVPGPNDGQNVWQMDPLATATATIATIDDSEVEPTEIVNLTIVKDSDSCSDLGFNVTVSSSPATLSIEDNDQSPLTVDPGSLNLSGKPGQTVTTNVQVSGSPYITVSSDLGSVTPEAIEGGSGTITFSYTIPAEATVGQTVSGKIELWDSYSDSEEPTTIPVKITVGGIADNPSLNDRQRRVAGALDSACSAIGAMPAEQRTPGQQRLLETCQMVEESGTQGSMLDQLSQRAVASQRRMALSMLQGQLTNLGGRLSNLRHGASGLDLSGLNVRFNGGFIPGALLQYAANGVLPDVGQATADTNVSAFSRLGVYINGSVVRGGRDSTEREQGYDTDIWNLTLGSDYRFTDRWVSGVALGYARNDTSYDGRSGGVDLDSYMLSLYGSYYHPDGYYFDAIFTYGRDDYDVSRRVDLSGDGFDAEAGPLGNQYLVSVDGGYDFYRKALTIGVQARATYFATHIDGYDETASDPTAPGAGALLHVDSQHADSLTTELLVQASYAISTRIGVFSPTTRVGWVHEFLQDSQWISARFVNDPTQTTFKARTDNPDRDYLNLGAGLSAQFAQGRSAFLFFESTLGQNNYHRNAIQGGIRLEF